MARIAGFPRVLGSLWRLPPAATGAGQRDIAAATLLVLSAARSWPASPRAPSRVEPAVRRSRDDRFQQISSTTTTLHALQLEGESAADRARTILEDLDLT